MWIVCAVRLCVQVNSLLYFLQDVGHLAEQILWWQNKSTHVMCCSPSRTLECEFILCPSVQRVSVCFLTSVTLMFFMSLFKVISRLNLNTGLHHHQGGAGHDVASRASDSPSCLTWALWATSRTSWNFSDTVRSSLEGSWKNRGLTTVNQVMSPQHHPLKSDMKHSSNPFYSTCSDAACSAGEAVYLSVHLSR